MREDSISPLKMDVEFTILQTQSDRGPHPLVMREAGHNPGQKGGNRMEEPKTTHKQLRETKTHHQTGYHKPERNPTPHYRMDKHKFFCVRCYAYTLGCPVTGRMKKSPDCEI